jgi:hypothetical protein
VGQLRGQLCGSNAVEVVALPPQLTSTLQVVEKHDVEGIVLEVVPVAQNTSQLVTGTPVLQVPVVIVAVGVTSPIASSTSSNNSSAIFERLMRGPRSDTGVRVPSSIPDNTSWTLLSIEAALLVSPQNIKQSPGSEIPR